MNKEESVRIFREMWSDIYEHIIKEKRRICIFDFKVWWCNEHGYRFINYCPLCEYSFSKYPSGCVNCPINWNSKLNDSKCTSLNYYNDFSGLYHKAINEYNWEKQAEIVDAIRNLEMMDINVQ